MARKLEEIRLLAEATAQQVTENAEEWKRFLDTAARIYRYPFLDQMLIYAQRPGATACASIDIWNEKMHCWVNKGAKGIALLDEEGLTPNGVKYVFDVADVHESRMTGRKPHLWEMDTKYEDAVISRLERIYGTTEPSALLENRLIEIAERIARDSYPDIMPELMQVVDGSALDGLEEADIAIRVQESLKASIAYTLMVRCGMDTEPWEEDLNFSHITDFNTMSTLSVIGNASSELTEPVLKEIGRTITAYDRGEILKTSLNLSQGLENAHDASYYSLNPAAGAAVDEYSETATKTSQGATERAERSVEHGTDIHTERGLSDSEPDGEQRTGGDADEIRPDAETVPEGTPEGDLHRDDAGRDAERTSADDSEPGGRADGLPDRAAGEVAGGERSTEGVRPDEVGTDAEQHPGVGGGDRFIGADLQLTEAETEQLSLFPSIAEQQDKIAAAEANRGIFAPAAVSFPEDDLDNDLVRGSQFEGGKMRIYALYQKEDNAAERVKFLKKEYGLGGHSHQLLNGESGFVDYNGRGILIHSFRSDYERRYTWSEVDKRILRLVQNGLYLNDRDKERWEALENKYAEVGGVPYPEPAYRMPEPEELMGEATKTAEVSEETSETAEASENTETPDMEEGWQPASEDVLSVFGEETEKTDRPAVGTFSIYQIKETSDLGEHQFESHEWMRRQGLELTPDKYDQVYTADVGILPGEVQSLEHQMEMIFTKFNIDRPEDFTGHSLSMSDVIVFHDPEGDGNDRAFYVDTIGFKEITEEFCRDRVAERQQDTPEHLEGEVIDEPYQVGDVITLEGTEFVIDEVREFDISMRDPRLLYPLFRVESRENLARLIREEAERNAPVSPQESVESEVTLKDVVIDLTPREEQQEEITGQDLSPEQMTLQGAAGQQDTAQVENAGSAPVNFRITDDNLGTGGAKEKFRRNMDAIYVLKALEEEGRQSTPEEQEVLSRYVGWGGLADAFDETKRDWGMQYQELAAALTPEEYDAARASTLNAHYTSPTVIKAMYEAIGNMGFTKGNILEPSCGVGNFLGLLPESMQESRMYGVELDSISGRIARQLYPESDIKIGGFEETDRRDFYDLAIGNVPFGNYKVNDKPYNKLNFNIHNYFFAKALDQVRPGGVVAFVTSRYTMDSISPEVRKYLAQRADLLGAIRLPNDAFKANAGTEVVSDIIFLQKRDRVMDIEPEWVHLGRTEDGHKINSYFTEHPEMVLGVEAEESTQYGRQDYTVKPVEGADLATQLKEAVARIQGQIEAAQIDEDELENDVSADFLPADPNVKNYSYGVIDDRVYYRENSVMKPVKLPEAQEGRIRGLVALRECTQDLINLQLEDYSDAEITAKQAELNERYDEFTKKYGLISAQGNKRAFSQDASYCLLCSLEKLDDEGNFIGKADMFTKRTIKRAQVVTSVDTASEALAVSLSEKARVDLDYMSELTGKTKKEITEELAGVIFEDPHLEEWQTADEYLSGNVREKLRIAREYAADYPEMQINVQALERVQPRDLEASEIDVRLGAPWVDRKYFAEFMRDTFQTPGYLLSRNVMAVQYSDVTGQWNIKGKNADYGNVHANVTYGTTRANAYKILEDSLNLKDVRIYDTVIEDGKEKRVLNKKETTLASQKQEAIREAFREWIFRDPERREELVKKYNELFNSTRPREYDGSHLTFPGMSPDIELKPHQLNAVAHVLYGHNTLLAHAVGAGKTFEMAAAAMESKRLGLSQKALFVVPNHLTEQWAADFLRLYPGANILAATKKDFEPANRKKFCSRIATGDYDAVIIGHSQFEKIPLSDERQITIIQRQINDIESAIATAKAERGERYTIKQMEKSKRSLEAKLQKLNDKSRKDNVVTFEQLGVDHIYVDESHSFKNLFLYTKMRNVAGIAQTEAQKSQDMFNKCCYLDELTGGKGVTFATGTPISNSMTELYTIMRYLQYDTLQRLGLGQFDSWAATFGETQTAIELAPEGTGYRAKTRFARFFNLPELIALFKESADIQTADMLDLKIPDAEYENIVLKPSDAQKEMVKSLADRAERVRNRMVDSSVDNMLKITNDGRKLALDQRLINDLLPDDPNNKSSACVEKAFEIWRETAAEKSTQLIFCDLSTPKGDGTFTVYEDIRDKLIAKGVPPEQIAFIHDANTDHRKAELFAKVRSGQVRFLLGSTAKMGAGTNVQDRLIALHHLDVPWRPSDIEQQEGRILRQGNTNPKVKIFRYVTEGTFDAYSWQVIENKQKFISQIMTSKSPVRSCDDIDETALSYAEVKALATGNPHIKEKMDLDIQVSKLKLLKANHTTQIYRLEDNIAKNYPKQIASLQERIEGFKADIATYHAHKPADKDSFMMTVAGKTYEDKKEAGVALIEACKGMKQANASIPVGEYLGMKMTVSFDAFDKKFTLSMKGQISHAVEIGADPVGNITRIGNAMENMTARMEEAVAKLANVEEQLATAREEVTKPFPQEEELKIKSARLAELNSMLNMDEKDESVLDVDEDAPKPVQTEKEQAIEVPDPQETDMPGTKEQEEAAMATTYEGFDTPIKEQDHNETPPERTEEEQMEQPQVTQPDTTPVTAEQLAIELDQFSEDVDPYNYMDSVEDREANIGVLRAQIMAGETEAIRDYLQSLIDEEAGTEEQLAQAKALIDKINEYKPLAKVEELEEQNFNMIDNVINNVDPDKKDRVMRDREPRQRVHFKEKLKEMKEAAAKQRQSNPEQEKTKKPSHQVV